MSLSRLYFVHVSMEMLSPRTGWKNKNRARAYYYNPCVAGLALACLLTWPTSPNADDALADIVQCAQWTISFFTKHDYLYRAKQD